MMLRALCAHLQPAAGASAEAVAPTVPVREELRGQPLDMPPPPAGVDAMARQFEADGFLHLPGCLAPTETAHLLARSEALWRQWGQSSRKGMHMVCSSSYDAEFLLPLDKEPTTAVAGVALGEGFALMGDSVWNNYERPDQQLHIDYQQWEAPGDGPEPALRPLAPLRVITAHYYLEDTYPELGPTYFIAGSHLAGRPPRESDQSAYNGMPDQSLLVKAGDCVMFRSDVWHRGGGNTCGEPRHIIQVHYCDALWVELFREGWDEERVSDAEAKQEAARKSERDGPNPNADALMKAKLSADPPEFSYPASSLAAATPKQRKLLEPVLASGAAYQQVKSAVMRAELRRLGKSSKGPQPVLIDRLNGRAE